MWNTSLEQVLDDIEHGRVISKHDGGFLLVDVAPNSLKIEPPARRASEHPPTFIPAPPATTIESDPFPPADLPADGASPGLVASRQASARLRRPPSFRAA
jgi:hypothetical protein